jgi:FAD/FMN-containing dehydrogenase
MDTARTAPRCRRHRPLRARIDGDVYTPEDEGWDEARRAWNLPVDQWPLAVAVPASAKDIVEIVDFARLEGLRVAPPGHRARRERTRPCDPQNVIRSNHPL